MTERLLVISSLRWGSLWQRHQSFSRAAAADGWSVDFIEPHVRSFRQVVTKPWRRTHNSDVPDREAQIAVPGISVIAAHRLLSLHSPYSLVLCYLPGRISELATRRLRVEKIVYDAVLDWATVPTNWYPPTGWRAAESRLNDKPHAVVTTDSPGMKRVLAQRGTSATIIYPAADDEFLGSARLKAYSARRNAVLYFGTVRDEVDTVLLSELARKGIEVCVVGDVVGPHQASELADSGVHIMPPVSIKALPVVVADFKIVILPYRGMRATSILPAKFWNCLVSGGWVVSRGIDTAALQAGNLRSLVQSVDENVALIKNLYKEEPPPTNYLPTWTQRWGELKAAAGVAY